MGDETKTADGRRRWQRWTEEQARAALGELTQSGVSLGKLYALQGPAFWKYGASSRMMRGHDGDRSEVVGASRRVARERQDG